MNMPGPGSASNHSLPYLIGFYTEGLPFDGATIRETGLGGSESAVYYLAREFATLGHQVVVFCHCPRPGLYEGVEYRDRRDFPRRAATTIFDVFIVSRFYGILGVPFRSRLTVMWNHDNLVEPRAFLQNTCRADLFFTLSAYHREEYLSQLPGLAPFLYQTKNGVDFALATSVRTRVTKDFTKVIYASRPERGLEYLLRDIWPRLHHRCPELRLFLAGYQVPDARRLPSLKTKYERIRALLASTPGVEVLGSLSKEIYYRHLAQAALLLYPCNFPEISCIVALEAQALGTPIITTRDFALPETVGVPDYLVPGRPADPDYQAAFIACARQYLEDRHKYLQDTERACRWVARHYQWSHIARQWLALFAQQLALRGDYQNPRLSVGLLGTNGCPPAWLRPLVPYMVDLHHFPLIDAWLTGGGGQVLDVTRLKSEVEGRVTGDWVLLAELAAGSLPGEVFLPYLAARTLDWFGFRRPGARPGHWAAVLFRRGCPIAAHNGLEIVISGSP